MCSIQNVRVQVDIHICPRLHEPEFVASLRAYRDDRNADYVEPSRVQFDTWWKIQQKYDKEDENEEEDVH